MQSEYMSKAGTHLEKLGNLLIVWGPKLLLAIVLLVVGIIVINRLVRLMRRVMTARKLDPTLVPFLSRLVGIMLKVMLIISVVDIVGVKTTSFVAVLGAAGLAVGLALQGSLANFAGGVLLMIFKPYKVGDFINAQGESGTVQAIHVFNTELTTPDNVRIIIPNGAMSSGTIINYSAQETRRLDLVFGISYGDDVEKALKILGEMAKEDARPQQESDRAPDLTDDLKAGGFYRDFQRRGELHRFAVDVAFKWCLSGNPDGVGRDDLHILRPVNGPREQPCQETGSPDQREVIKKAEFKNSVTGF
jgi:small conductance mechanosensitive channel